MSSRLMLSLSIVEKGRRETASVCSSVRKRANEGRGRQQAGSRHVCHEEQQDIPATRQKRLLRSIIHDFNRQRPLSL
eukprot:7015372-Prymnesium_polylepis.1